MPRFNHWRTVGDIDLTALTPSGTWAGSFGSAGTASQINTGALTTRSNDSTGIITTTSSVGEAWGDNTYTAYSDSIILNGFYGVAGTVPIPTAAQRWRAWLYFTTTNLSSDGQFVYFGWSGNNDANGLLNAYSYMGHFTTNLVGMTAEAGLPVTPQSSFAALQPVTTVSVMMVELTSPWIWRVAYATMGGGGAWPREQDLIWNGNGAMIAYPSASTNGIVSPQTLSTTHSVPAPVLTFAHVSQSNSTPFTVTRKRLRLQEYVA